MWGVWWANSSTWVDCTAKIKKHEFQTRCQQPSLAVQVPSLADTPVSPSKSFVKTGSTAKWQNSTHLAEPNTTRVPILQENMLPSCLLHAKLRKEKRTVSLIWNGVRQTCPSYRQLHLRWPNLTWIPTLVTVKGETIRIVCALYCITPQFSEPS